MHLASRSHRDSDQWSPRRSTSSSFAINRKAPNMTDEPIFQPVEEDIDRAMEAPETASSRYLRESPNWEILASRFREGHARRSRKGNLWDRSHDVCGVVFIGHDGYQAALYQKEIAIWRSDSHSSECDAAEAIAQECDSRQDEVNRHAAYLDDRESKANVAAKAAHDKCVAALTYEALAEYILS